MQMPFGDDPISDPSDDLLGRDSLAEALSAEIAALNAQHGVVVAITGPWGSGKTSLMNLTAARLRNDPGVFGVVEFNPWLFSGAEQLAENLLSELAVQLRDQESRKDRARRVASSVTEKLLTYSGALSFLRVVPVASEFYKGAEETLKGAGAVLRGDQSLQQRRQDAIEALSGLDGRVVVLVDDIDRLTRSETRDLFRTVRLSASFPNLIYILCLDHNVVAKALDEDGFSGIAYLEKILTVTCRVPDLADHQIARLFADGLNAVIAQHATGPDDEAMWNLAFPAVMRPLSKTMRDAKRVLASLPITLRLIGTELPVIDVVLLECLRVLYPALYAAVEANADALTQPATPAVMRVSSENARLSAGVQEFIAADDRFGGRMAIDLIQTLFRNATARLPRDAIGWTGSGQAPPGGAGWPNGLRFFLTHQLPPGVATSGSVRAVIHAFGEESDLRAALTSIPDDRLEDALERLVEPAERILPAAVPASVKVMLEQFPRLRTEIRGMHDFGSEFSITRPVLRMLRRLQPDAVMDLARQLLGETPTIFAAFELVTLVGHRENAGHRLVSEGQAVELERLLRARIRAAGNELAAERNLTRVLFHSCELTPDQPVFPEVMSGSVAAAILRSGIATTRQQDIDGLGPMTVSHSLNWDILTAIFGGEQGVASAAVAIREDGQINDQRVQQALDLVDQYLEGWRPSDPFSD
jgi:hypothetical protein